MEHVISYHVLNGTNGKWLDADEKTWTNSYIDSAAFNDAKLAQDIAARETGPHGIFYVMACMGHM